MLDDTLKAQLQQYLGMLRQPIRLVASLDDSETGKDMGELLNTIVGPVSYTHLTLPTNREV